jgi:hypothetical protein
MRKEYEARNRIIVWANDADKRRKCDYPNCKKKAYSEVFVLSPTVVEDTNKLKERVSKERKRKIFKAKLIWMIPFTDPKNCPECGAELLKTGHLKGFRQYYKCTSCTFGRRVWQ